MAIQTYKEWYYENFDQTLGPGTHYATAEKPLHLRSAKVDKKTRMKAIEHVDGTGNESPWYYGPTDFSEGYLYPRFIDYPGRIVVETTAIEPDQMVRVGWTRTGGGIVYNEAVNVIPGDNYGDDLYPNDQIWWLHVPFGVTAHCYENGDKSGAHFPFTGVPGGLHVDLRELGFDGKISCITVEADDWEYAGCELLDVIEAETYQQLAQTFKLHNNTRSEPQATGSVTIEMGSSQEESTEKSHEIGAGLEASIGTSVGGGIGPVEVTVEASVTASASFTTASAFSKTSSTSQSVSQSIEVSAPVPPGESYNVSIMVNRERAVYRAAKTYRNKTNSELLRQIKRIEIDNAVNAEAVVSNIHGVSVDADVKMREAA